MSLLNKISRRYHKKGSKSKKIKTTKFEDMEKAIHDEFVQARSINIQISGLPIQEKASEVATKMGLIDFNASNEWIDQFKARDEKKIKQVCDKSVAVNNEDFKCWKTNILPQLVKNYSSRDIYNVDEFGLFHKMTPKKTMAMK